MQIFGAPLVQHAINLLKTRIRIYPPAAVLAKIVFFLNQIFRFFVFIALTPCEYLSLIFKYILAILQLLLFLRRIINFVF
jgi:hypothetical protein